MTSFLLNGQTVLVPAEDAHLPLLHFLRQRGMTGTKEGCAEGECGACAVVLRVKDSSGQGRYEPVNSCLLLTGSAVGHEVLTVEGLASGAELHPVQQAMVERGGSQCGYCTPGFVMSLFAEYYRPERTGYDPEAISGNLCRCTGYRPIRDALMSLEYPSAQDPFKKRLALAAPNTASVSFHGERRFYRPTTLAEATALLQATPSLPIVAGGTDVVVEMNQRQRRFDALLSLENVQELKGVSLDDTSLRIGASVTLSELERELHGQVPLLDELFPLFSSRLVRNRATLGGNLGTGSPIGDSPPVLLALDAELELASHTGSRRIPLQDFFLAYRKTALVPGELIVSVRIPRPFPTVQRFYKVSKRVLDDISTVAAAFAVHLEAGVITQARLAFGGVAATPMRALIAERELQGKRWQADLAERVRPLLEQAFTPMNDHRGSATYRQAMVGELFSKLCFEMAPSPGP